MGGVVVGASYNLSWCHRSIKTFSLSSFTRKTSAKQQDSSDASASDDVVVITEQEEGLDLNEVRSQLLRFVDLFIWTALLSSFLLCLVRFSYGGKLFA